MNESITSKGSNQAQKLGKLKQGFIVSSGISGERSVSPLPPSRLENPDRHWVSALKDPRSLPYRVIPGYM